MKVGGLTPSPLARLRCGAWPRRARCPRSCGLSDEAETALNLARPARAGSGAAARAARWPSSATRAGRRTCSPGERAPRADPARVRRCSPMPRPARRGRATATRGPTCATRCSTPAPSSRRSRRRPSGRTRCAFTPPSPTALREQPRRPGHATGHPLPHLTRVPAGASLYFTVGCAQLDDPVAQWLRPRRAAGEAIARRRRHDHPPSRHRPRPPRLLRARNRPARRRGAAARSRRRLDPAGILNPGILIPDE